jgi:radical SAM-linked protein
VRLRLRATKLGKVRFVSHRDTARLWERAMRRAGLPVATSAGFTPRPRLSFGLALPTGAESIAEYVDVELRDGTDVDLDALPATLSAVLPAGMDVVAAAVGDRADGSLQESVTSTTWELWSDGRVDEAAVARAVELLDAPALLLERERKGVRRTDDVRPAVLALTVGGDGCRLVADLATTGRGLRPAELAALAFRDVDPLDVRALRTHQWIDHDDARREVLPLPAVVTLLAEAASA